jgi:4'-phosphopantetheinyl transferase
MTDTAPTPMGLDEREVHVWYAATEVSPDPATLSRFRDWLSPEETARYQRFMFDRDRQQFLMTHALGRSVLSRYVAVPPEEWQFSAGKLGRPEIASPAFERPLRFNLSRTCGLVVCAVAWDRELGVDVENLERPNLGLDLISRYFAPAEIEELGRLSIEEQRRRFFDYWTLKEAYLKARGWGLSAPLDKFWFYLESGRAPWVAFDESLADDPGSWQFNQYAPTTRHLIALAVRRGTGEEEIAVTVRDAELGSMGEEGEDTSLDESLQKKEKRFNRREGRERRGGREDDYEEEKKEGEH